MPSPIPMTVPAPGAGACVYYDGGCPLCRAEIATYRRTEGGDTLRWVDAQACGPAELGPGLARPAALARLHVRRADGTLLDGARAFVEIWSALPSWRVLARLARLPGMLPLLDGAYAVFLRLRPLWRRAQAADAALPRALWQDLRSDHAGETGAVMIYRGVLAIARDPALRAFAQQHLETERRHLAQVEAELPSRWRSRLLPLWRLVGWLTGALPALAGPRAVYATVQAVETFVDHHYAAQTAAIDARLAMSGDRHDRAALARLRALIEACRADEVEHRDDAGARWDGCAGKLLAWWRAAVGRGSALAVQVCRRV